MFGMWTHSLIIWLCQLHVRWDRSPIRREKNTTFVPRLKSKQSLLAVYAKLQILARFYVDFTWTRHLRSSTFALNKTSETLTKTGKLLTLTLPAATSRSSLSDVFIFNTWNSGSPYQLVRLTAISQPSPRSNVLLLLFLLFLSSSIDSTTATPSSSLPPPPLAIPPQIKRRFLLQHLSLLFLFSIPHFFCSSFLIHAWIFCFPSLF